MEQKWYRSGLTKAVLIIAAHIFVIIATVNFAWTCAYPALQDEMFAEKPAKKYEDSRYFENQMQHYAHQAIVGIGVKELFETDGEYDPDKIVDIKTCFETNAFEGKESSGLSYRLGDLIDWFEAIYDESAIEEYSDENRIFVCKKADDTYHYYRAAEFYELLEKESLRFVIAGSDSEYTYNSVIVDLQSGSDFPEGMFRGLQDGDGKMLYSECWIYDGDILKERYSPIEEKDILSIVNNNPEWNGKLSDAYAMIRDVIDTVYEDYQEYIRTDADIEEGDSNFSYIYADTKNHVVFTNRKEYKNYKKLEENLEEIKNTGKYVIAKPKLADFDTNMDNADPDAWRKIGEEAGGNNKDFLLAASVDTAYPIQDAFYSENQMYAQYGADARGILISFAVSMLLFILCTVGLCVMAGRGSKDEELHLNRFDLWKSEIAAAVVIVLWAIPVAFVYESVIYGIVRRANVTDAMPYIILAGAVAAYTCAWFLTGLLSLIRRIKAGVLWKNSILKILCRWLLRICKAVVEFVGMIVSNLSCIWKTILAFGIFWVLEFIFVLSIFIYGADGLTVLILLLANIVPFIYLMYRSVGMNTIQKGIRKISDGEVEYQIPLKNLRGDQKTMAEKINSIGEGLDAAVEKSMRSERLKTDLITNVSHDIKTPLTSIINYVELLKQENFEDPKIKRYIEVLEQKSQRLKNLTEDVVEASKVSSGNISLEYVQLNLTEMLQQVSGEFEEKFKEKNLKEVLILPGGETVIRADGRRTWRIFENIYNNASKYAMEGTRVYAELVKRDGRAIFTLKNISSQELNISADELTERFIRGDISRSTEGSGLGLSIAKSLTTMQGGSFDLYLDGDLFKVTIQFPTCA